MFKVRHESILFFRDRFGPFDPSWYREKGGLSAREISKLSLSVLLLIGVGERFPVLHFTLRAQQIHFSLAH